MLNCYLGRSHPKNLRGTLLPFIFCRITELFAELLAFGLQSADWGSRGREGEENSGLIFARGPFLRCAVSRVGVALWVSVWLWVSWRVRVPP